MGSLEHLIITASAIGRIIGNCRRIGDGLCIGKIRPRLLVICLILYRFQAVGPGFFTTRLDRKTMLTVYNLPGKVRLLGIVTLPLLHARYGNTGLTFGGCATVPVDVVITGCGCKLVTHFFIQTVKVVHVGIKVFRGSHSVLILFVDIQCLGKGCVPCQKLSFFISGHGTKPCFDIHFVFGKDRMRDLFITHALYIKCKKICIRIREMIVFFLFDLISGHRRSINKNLCLLLFHAD